jgi:cbb3-type cytochrome oxidase maturation protein
MNIIFLMIPMAMFLGVGFVFAFIWAVKSGQFDDTETPQHRALIDNDIETHSKEKV